MLNTTILSLELCEGLVSKIAAPKNPVPYKTVKHQCDCEIWSSFYCSLTPVVERDNITLFANWCI